MTKDNLVVRIKCEDEDEDVIGIDFNDMSIDGLSVSDVRYLCKTLNNVLNAIEGEDIEASYHAVA